MYSNERCDLRELQFEMRMQADEGDVDLVRDASCAALDETPEQYNRVKQLRLRARLSCTG